MELPDAEAASLRRDLEVLWSQIGWPPGHYYSPLPDAADVRARAERIFAPGEVALPGIDLNEHVQLDLLRRLERFAPIAGWQDAEGPTRYRVPNTFFSLGDATLLSAMLRYHRPARFIEIGSGFSSAAALDVCDAVPDLAIAFTFVEPYPERLASLLRPEDAQRVTRIDEKIQDVDLTLFETLRADDVLFIDSSHVAKVGSDVNRIFFEILPRLRAGVIVHVHDIFYPFEYPQAWIDEGRYWNEAYLLRAFLTHNKAFEILCFANFLSKHRAEHLTRLVPGHESIGGGSFWMRKIA